jgi:hypothetical protein
MSNSWQKRTGSDPQSPKSEDNLSRNEGSENTCSQDDARLHWLVAANPQTPATVLVDLAQNANTRLLARIAENQHAPASLLSELARHPDPEVRAAVAENISTPEDSLWRLVRDESPDVRYVLAENYWLPMDMLDLLAQDDNPYVSFRARKTGSRLSSAEIVERTFARPDERKSRLQ